MASSSRDRAGSAFSKERKQLGAGLGGLGINIPRSQDMTNTISAQEPNDDWLSKSFTSSRKHLTIHTSWRIRVRFHSKDVSWGSGA